MRSSRLKWFLGILGLFCALYLILLIPDASPPTPPAGDKEPFAWNRDEYWMLLEKRFKEARAAGCVESAPQIAMAFSRIDSLMVPLPSDTLSPEAPVFTRIEDSFFELGILLAACPERLPDYIKTLGRLRTLAKNQSLHWDMNSKIARDRIYRLLYGGRTAIEEIILQSSKKDIAPVVPENEEPSATPFTVVLGVKIHSGDILVSRGGAPTSALIARGNDYPGNFSHIALVYVDKDNGTVSIIESHIERGVVISSVEDYLEDTKLRIMVLRLRSDLSALMANPMLPHEAALYALQRAESEHIPYDFTMNDQESSKLFCSEVASNAYSHAGVKLWAGMSHISDAGIASWLAAFGVRHFTTQEPSDLEYDPQLRVVAEWRDYETLHKDHLDNAVVDIMLESADAGVRLAHDRYRLPLARIIKAYSVIINQFGGIGPIPEGMSATVALRNQWFSNKHQETKERLLVLARQFEQDNGYFPPYWELIKLARKAYSS